jgi:hypothetical protein
MTEDEKWGAVAAAVEMVSNTKIGDWKPQIDEVKAKRKAQIELADWLRNVAELVMGYSDIDPTKSCIPRNRIPRKIAEQKRRAAMSPQERAQIDLLHEVASAEVDIMKREGLTFREMWDVREAALNPKVTVAS